jgi:hypothetical protein
MKNYSKRLLKEFPYLGKLSEADANYLIQFAKEYHQGYFKKGVDHLHSTPELKKKVSDKRNSERRCALNSCPTVPYDEPREND